MVEQISESDGVTIETLLFSENLYAEYSPTEIITAIYQESCSEAIASLPLRHFMNIFMRKLNLHVEAFPCARAV